MLCSERIDGYILQMLDSIKLLTAFTSSIFEKARALEDPLITGRQKRYLNKAISFEIRHACDAMLPDNLIPRVSVNAEIAARRIGVDLRLLDWHDQPKFDPGRKLFHLEHIVPVSDIRKSCCIASSREAVLEVLINQIAVAWILKEEDERLVRLGFRSIRPDPEAAYRAAGIELI